MGDELEQPGEAPEQHGAEPHLPRPTIWPFGFAAGVAVLLVGLVVSWPIVAVGAAVAVVFGFLWVRDLTREVRRKPEPEPEPLPAPTHELVEEEREEEEPRYTRSVFLSGTTLGIGAAIGAVVTVPVVGFAIAPAFVGQGYDNIDLGPLSNFPDGKWLVTTFRNDKDSESNVSLRTAYIRSNGFKDNVPSFTIISNHCAHLGCPVQPNGPTGNTRQIHTTTGPVELTPTQPSGFGCPCHGGQYDTEGNRTAGPPVRALDRYMFSVVKNRLVLGAPYSVAKVQGAGADAVIKAYNTSYDPGVHVDGWEQILYPYNP